MDWLRNVDTRIRHGRLGLVLFYGYFIAIAVAAGAFIHLENKDRAQIHANMDAVSELCGQGAVIEDVVRGGIAVVAAELRDPNVPDGTHAADRKFLARFHRDLLAVQYLLTNPKSACQRAAP